VAGCDFAAIRRLRRLRSLLERKFDFLSSTIIPNQELRQFLQSAGNQVPQYRHIQKFLAYQSPIVPAAEVDMMRALGK
jgi:hypothetical protein